MSATDVRAAGGLVVRDGRVLLVHRPRYDDWSLPKGKLDPGEDWETAALREVHEEAGVRARLREPLPSVHYTDAKGRSKTVRYWRMEVEQAEPFAPNDEVDEVAWLEPADAVRRLTYDHDREIVAAWSGQGREIERKFRVARLPEDLADHPSRRLAQGYLTTGHVEVRLRRADDDTFLTIKSGDGLVRAEEEMAIDADRFERLWPLTEGRRVEKVRHLIAAGSRTIELDVYGGANEGLLIAEVEFPSEQEARSWQPPDWLGEDVTGDPALRNARLAS
jgi:CYTH domain-containing protein/8-oxo-dGTP pyrophosphatase MutT (NUDIX family)